MALILPTLGELSGSVRGNVFSHNKGGAYLRGRTIPTNPSSTKQAAARSFLSSLAAQWSQMDDGQRATWNAYAESHPMVNRLGQSTKRTGQQWFIGLNSRRLGAGLAATTAAPSTTGPIAIAAPTITANFGLPANVHVDFTPDPLPSDTYLVLWGTLPAQPGSDPNRNQARLIGYSEVEADSPVTFASPYAAANLQVSNFWVCLMDTGGQMGPGIRVGQVVYG